jgi:hypothetical protein
LAWHGGSNIRVKRSVVVDVFVHILFTVVQQRVDPHHSLIVRLWMWVFVVVSAVTLAVLAVLFIVRIHI